MTGWFCPSPHPEAFWHAHVPQRHQEHSQANTVLLRRKWDLPLPLHHSLLWVQTSTEFSNSYTTKAIQSTPKLSQVSPCWLNLINLSGRLHIYPYWTWPRLFWSLHHEAVPFPLALHNMQFSKYVFFILLWYEPLIKMLKRQWPSPEPHNSRDHTSFWHRIIKTVLGTVAWPVTNPPDFTMVGSM